MSGLELLVIGILGLIFAIIVLEIIYLTIRAKKHPLYHKAKKKEGKEREDMISKIIDDTIEDHLGYKKHIDKIESIIEKHLSSENIEKTVKEVTEQLKKEGKIDKDYVLGQDKKGEDSEV